MGMDPNQQNPGSPQGNPYEFILNPNEAPKKKDLGFKNNFVRTIVFVVGGTILLMIAAVLVLNALAPKKISITDLTGLAQTQTELLRISRQASSDATQQTTRNLATTVEYTMLTHQKQTLEVITKNGGAVDGKILALKQNSSTDQKFRAAKSTSTFDTTYTEIIQTELDDYAVLLKNLSQVEAASTSERNRMSDYYRQVQDLLSQVPYTQDDINSGSATTTPTQ
jgi:hypothetical protein